MLTEPAPGKQLDKFIQEDLPHMPEEEAIKHLIAIGRQMGNFHASHAKLHEGYPQLEGLTHGDLSHLGNIFYDNATENVTLIDYEAMGVKTQDPFLTGEIASLGNKVGYFLTQHPFSYVRAFATAYLDAFPQGPLRTMAAEYVWGHDTSKGIYGAFTTRDINVPKELDEILDKA